MEYNEYLMAIKRVHRRQSMKTSIPHEMRSPRELHRLQQTNDAVTESGKARRRSAAEAERIATVAAMVPDEIVYAQHRRAARRYQTALMFIDVSGFTELCERYTKAGRGGPSRLSQVLNTYIGAMVQEILTYNGDVLKFSGDAFLSMWKKTDRISMNDCVHTAIDCGLTIQKNYGACVTDVGITLKVKIAVSAGECLFSVIGGADSARTSFVIVGPPVWDVKKAEIICKAGDVLTSASAWRYISESWYCTQAAAAGHVRVLGVGATWKRVSNAQAIADLPDSTNTHNDMISIDTPEIYIEGTDLDTHLREFALRPAIITAMRGSTGPELRRFMLAPVLRAVDNDEPMDFLTEVRRVVVVFLNIVTKTVTEDELVDVVDGAFRCVSCIAAKSGGLVNKVSMFDKDMMFLVVFGLRGLKQEDEAQKALECALHLKTALDGDNIKTISIGITSGTTYCGVVGHVLRREYTVIGTAVNKAARLMMAYAERVTCDKETFLRSKLEHKYFRLLEAKTLKGIAKPGPIYEFNKEINWCDSHKVSCSPLLGRDEELQTYKETLFNAMQQRHASSTRYRDHRFGIAIQGPSQVGKTRLFEECLNVTPKYIRVEKIVLTEESQQYANKIASKIFGSPLIVRVRRSVTRISPSHSHSMWRRRRRQHSRPRRAAAARGRVLVTSRRPPARIGHIYANKIHVKISNLS